MLFLRLVVRSICARYSAHADYSFRRLVAAIPSFVLAGCCLIGQSLVFAQTAGCPPAAPTIGPEQISQGLKNAQNRGPLWRLEKAGRTSWLYGTVHAARAEWLFPGPAIVRALLQSDALALELNVLDAESLKPLTQPVDPAQAQRVLIDGRAERLARQTSMACLPPAALDQLRPALRAITLLVLGVRQDGFYTDFAVDAVLAGAAQAMKKPIIALESAQDQVDLLAGRSDTEERSILDAALKELESGKGSEQGVLLMQAWAAADVARLNDYPVWCKCMDQPQDRAMMKRLLDDRNVLMADKIALMHDAGQRVFAGVGVLHMIGKQGLPALMRAKGYRVELEMFSAKP